MKITGLTKEEVAMQQNAGLSSIPSDFLTPTYFKIIFRNLFNLINIFIFPLLILLAFLGKYKEMTIIGLFALINSLLSIFDEIRIKYKLDNIQVNFIKTITVIREGKEQEISVDKLVLGDIVKLIEGEGVPIDGEILDAKSLQVDESLLTGESNYISKEQGDDLLGGSFIITGECIYKVRKKDSYINLLNSYTKSFKKDKSNLQLIGDKLTIFFVMAALVLGIITYLSAKALGYSTDMAIISLTAVTALIIPQTLIFLFTFSFSISILKLSNIGVLVQRGSSIETLSNLDVLCFDKTGTITTNEMHVSKIKLWNLDESTIGGYFQYIKDLIFGKNKTFDAIEAYFLEYKVASLESFSQSPFTSKVKYARNQFFDKRRKKYVQFYYGALNIVENYIEKKLLSEIYSYITNEENQGLRILIGIVHESDVQFDFDDKFRTNKVFVISIQEELNKGIKKIIDNFKQLGTELKIISGDSYQSVKRIIESTGLSMENAVDLSKSNDSLTELAKTKSIFTRAKPEDKLTIIQTIRQQGKLVGMVGDGVNDVPALKLASVGISMEYGSKIARDVADIVLLKNDFSLIPKILYEAENIIVNLKYMNKLFISKTFYTIFFILICVVSGLIFPLLPTSILVYGFLSSSLPSYIIALVRRNVKSGKEFLKEIMPSSLISGFLAACASIVIYRILMERNFDFIYINTAIMYGALVFGLFFAMQQAKKTGYLKRWFEPILCFLIINMISIIPMLISFLSSYYDLTMLNIDTWGIVYINSISFFIIYLCIEKIISRKILYKRN